jgi:hypothetical protein
MVDPQTDGDLTTAPFACNQSMPSAQNVTPETQDDLTHAAPPDWGPLLEAAKWRASDGDLDAWLVRWIILLTQYTAAQRGVLLVADPAEDTAGDSVTSLRVEAECLAGDAPRTLHRERLIDQPAAEATAPQRVVNFVVHSGQSLALADVSRDIPFDSGARAGALRPATGTDAARRDRVVGRARAQRRAARPCRLDGGDGAGHGELPSARGAVSGG